jgi:hypothetical protein
LLEPREFPPPTTFTKKEIRKFLEEERIRVFEGERRRGKKNFGKKSGIRGLLCCVWWYGFGISGWCRGESPGWCWLGRRVYGESEESHN